VAELPLNPPGCAPGERLDAELRRQAVPILGVSVTVPASGPRSAVVHYPDGTSQADQDRGNQIAAGFDLRDAQLCSLSSLYQSVAALSQTQRNNIWADLSAPATPTPRKYLTDYGTNASAIFTMDYLLYVVGGTAAQVDSGRNDIISFWTQDNPQYLINPAFDPSISVPGYLLVG
jgi:hypothetical protein